MKVLARLIVVLILVALVGGAGFLAYGDIEAPMERIEIVIPNDRFNE
jgi:hypothetical protein